MANDFIMFCIAGGIAAGVNVSTRVIFGLVMPFEWSIFPAYLAGLSVAFLLNRKFVFKKAGTGIAGQYARFGLVNLAAAAQVWLVSVGLADLVFPAAGLGSGYETAAHAVGVLSPVATSYLAHKYFTFAR